MSQVNVEIVRRWAEIYEATRRYPDSEFFSQDVIYRPMANFTETEECRGLAALRRWIDAWRETWADDFIDQVTNIRDCGDAVSVRIEFSGHARTSGIPISDVMFRVFWLQDGLIMCFQDFATSAEALKAAGGNE
jgi:hypothetical protein